MTRDEAIKIVDKVKVYRQTFNATVPVYQEWFKVLEPYDYEDVDRKLDDYFRNGDNFGKYPDAYYLTKYLKKHDEKLQQGHMYVRCQVCGKTIDYASYDEHFNRCSSVDYLDRMASKHYGKKVDKEKLMKMSQQDFDTYYWKICESIKGKSDSVNLEHALENAILTHKGEKPNLNLSQIMGGSL